MDARYEPVFGPRRRDAVASRTVMLDDDEYREVTAALELMIEHCNGMLAHGPVDSFSARRRSAQAILQKLRSSRS